MRAGGRLRLRTVALGCLLFASCNFQPVRDATKISCVDESGCESGELCLPRAADSLKVCTPMAGLGSGGAGGRATGGSGGTRAGGSSGQGGSGQGAQGGQAGQGGTTGGGTPGGGGGGAGSDAGDAANDSRLDTAPADLRMEAAPPADWPECPEGQKTVAQSELDNGLVVFIPFEDAPPGLTLGDASINMHRILPRDFALATAQVSAGRHGKAVDLSKGTNNLRGYVTVDMSTQINAIRSFTIGTWIKFPSGKSSDGVILSRRFRMAGLLFNLEIVNGSTLRGQLFTGRPGAGAGLIMGALPQTAKWMHVAMTFVQSPNNSPQPGMRLYVDGTAIAEGPFPFALGEDLGPIVVGGAEDEMMNFDNPPVIRRLGTLVDEVVVYNRVLPAATLKALACGARPTLQP